MSYVPFKDHWQIKKLFVLRYFLIFLSFLMVLITAFPSQGAPVVKLSKAIVFSSLVERGSDPDAMNFDSNGDLYYFGWNHGLEKISADQIPDGTHQLLLDKSDYGSFFNEPSLSEIKNITGFGIGFNSLQKVISYIKGLYRTSGSDTDEIKIGFASCNKDGSDLIPLALIAGEDFIGLNRVKKAEGGYETLDVHQGEIFSAGDRDLFQMKIVDLNGNESILFTLWGLPDIFQVPSSGGVVTSFYRFQDGYPRGMTIMGEDLIVTHNDGNIYRINLINKEKSDFVTQSQLINFLGLDSGNICFTEIDYEPVSNKIYCVAQVCWNTDVPQTMMAISPDGLSITKILDENSLTQDLAFIRTPPEGKKLKIQAVSVDPVAVSQGKPSLFLGDYWSGLEMVRMDFPPSVHNVNLNCPFGAYLELDPGSGKRLLCHGPFGRIEGPFPEFLFLPQGKNEILVDRDGVGEEYIVNILPAFSIASRCKRGQVQLSWDHRPGITRYDIFRSSEDDPGNFIKIAETVSTYSVYLDRSVTNEKTYLYTVAAVYDQSSEFSTVVAATPSASRRPGNFDPVIYSSATSEDAWTGTTFTYRVLSIDSNGDNLTYSLSNAPAGMSIGADGLIRWVPDATQAGPLTFTVIITDNEGGQVSQVVTVATKIRPSGIFEWVYADPDGGFVGEQTLVTVTTQIQPGADINPSSLSLLQYGDDYRITNDLGSLYDDGTHGDSQAGDDIFTTQVPFLEYVKSILHLRVAAETISGGDQIYSDFFDVSIFEHITDAEFTAILEIHDAAKQRFEGYIAQDFDVELALEKTAAWIRLQPEVVQANVFLAAFNISIIYECGVIGGVSFRDSIDSDNSIGAIRGGGLPDGDDVAVENSPMLSLPNGNCTVGNNSVFIAGSFKFDFDHSEWVEINGGDESNDIADMYRNDCRFDVADYYDEQVTVDAMKSIGNHGIIVLTGHGDAVDLTTGDTWGSLSKYFIDPPERTGQVGYLTGENPSLLNKFQHELDLLQHRLFIHGKYYMILPSFVTRYGRFFPDSIVYVGACFSSWNQTLANAFINAGASTYIGFSHMTWGTFAYPFAMNLFQKLLQEDMSVGDIYGAQECQSERMFMGLNHYLKRWTCCTMLSGKKDMYGTTNVIEVGAAVLGNVYSLGQPVDVFIRGKHFPPNARVTVRYANLGEEVDFGSLMHMDCESLTLKDAVFLLPGIYDVCVESLSGGDWQGQCVALAVGLPTIYDVNPKENIPVGQDVSIEITGVNLSAIHTILIEDPEGNTSQAAFTLIDDTDIRIPAHTFLSAGEHRIVLTSNTGEAEESVMVVEETPDVEWALRASASVQWIVPEIGTREIYEDNETPVPFEGRESTTISAEAIGGLASIEAQFMTPIGENVQQQDIDVVNISAKIIAPPLVYGNHLLFSMVDSGVVFQEVIEIVGAQLPDGTEVRDGSLTCHLEVSGEIDISGPLTTTGWTGWNASNAYYSMRLFAAAVPDGFSLVPPLYGRMEGPVHVFDAGLERLTDFWVAWGSSTQVLPVLSPSGVSSSFDLPIGGKVVLYNDRLNFEVNNGNDALSMFMDTLVDVKLVPDQPGVTLIYRK